MRYTGWLILILVTLGAIVGKMTLGPFIQVLGVKPDMSLVLVAFMGFNLGPRFGVAMGLVVGLLQDGMFGGHIGFQAIVHAASGLVGGLVERRVSAEHLLSPLILGMLSTLVAESIALLLIDLTGGEPPVFEAFRRVILIESLYNGVFGVLVFRFVHSLSQAVRPKFSDSTTFIGRLP